MSETEMYKRLYEKAAVICGIYHDQNAQLKNEQILDAHTINNLVEINMICRNCLNCNKQIGCSDIHCKDMDGYFPSWKMRTFK